MSYTIIEEEIIEWLESYEGERFHALLSDPPYALISIAKRFGKEGSAPAQEGMDGRFSRLSGGFMGQQWDGFESLAAYRTWIKKWGKLLIKRVLHPGAVCLFFGGTRTWHHLALGLEDAGFEIYDTMMWLYGSGFPKSHDISKGIDRASGAKRTKGAREWEGGQRKSGIMGENLGTSKRIIYDEPATDEAKKWQGYGTGLKPAWEPILVCRVPREDKTFASLALKHGSGALNIDGARISAGEDHKRNTNRKEVESHWRLNKSPRRSVEAHPLGRWPANLLLHHHKDCVKIGEYQVPARVINRWKSGMKPFGEGAGGEYETIHPSREGEPSAERTYEDEGSTNFAMKPGPRRDKDMETVERWACVPECPIRQLDDRVGELKSGLMKSGTTRKGEVYYSGMFKGCATKHDTYADTGGPSRFFYCGKASRNEKDKGLEEFYWERVGKGFERIDRDRYEQLPRRKRARGNIHPTVKPLDLLRYLATLLLPPADEDRIRKIFIPFSGSGSELIACIQAGWDDVVAVELEPKYNEIAHARIRANIGMF